MRSLPLVFSLLSSSAFAVSVQFNFDVNSSSASIYPCDAGLKHASHASTICYNQETQTSCTPSTSQEDSNCVCTGPETDEYRMDSMTANIADWSDNGNLPTNTSTVSVTSGSSSFARIFSSDQEWTKQLRSLAFDFGSSRYGSEFYLDVCYRGPQVRATGNPNHAVFLQSTITDLVKANYSALSDLNIKVAATCDLQGEGALTSIPSGDVTDNQISGISGGDVTHTTDYASFASGATLTLLHDWINSGKNNIPRFCKIRFSFLENMRNNTTDPLDQLRKWESQKARISTLSDISPKNSL